MNKLGLFYLHAKLNSGPGAFLTLIQKKVPIQTNNGRQFVKQ